jgi:hypothetical protein
LRNDEASGGVYIRFIRQFLDATILEIDPENVTATQNAIAAFFEFDFTADVSDDKTLVCLVREGFAPPVIDEAYYAEPDWGALRKKQNSRLYTSGG